ncbi:hypothetical protein [Marinobacter sp.]|uniref:hypothetical protein n=1 Tax=Marinobacter sp. TaxID=50741 RepID=UPI00235463B4|nr:hypothetical protein [Marinobacter sp.]
MRDNVTGMIRVSIIKNPVDHYLGHGQLTFDGLITRFKVDVQRQAHDYGFHCSATFIAFPISSAICGTMEFPKARS